MLLLDISAITATFGFQSCVVFGLDILAVCSMASLVDFYNPCGFIGRKMVLLSTPLSPCVGGPGISCFECAVLFSGLHFSLIIVVSDTLNLRTSLSGEVVTPVTVIYEWFVEPNLKFC